MVRILIIEDDFAMAEAMKNRFCPGDTKRCAFRISSV